MGNTPSKSCNHGHNCVIPFVPSRNHLSCLDDDSENDHLLSTSRNTSSTAGGRSTYQQPLSHSSADIPFKNVLLQKMCVVVSRSIGKDWKCLGRLLEVPDDVLNSLEKDYQSNMEEMAYNMLHTWTTRMSQKATVDELVENLRVLEHTDLVERISQMARKSATSMAPSIHQAASKGESKDQSASSQQQDEAQISAENMKHGDIGSVGGDVNESQVPEPKPTEQELTLRQTFVDEAQISAENMKHGDIGSVGGDVNEFQVPEPKCTEQELTHTNDRHPLTTTGNATVRGAMGHIEGGVTITEFHTTAKQPLSKEYINRVWQSLQSTFKFRNEKLQIPTMPWLNNWELELEDYYVDLLIEAKHGQSKEGIHLHEIFQPRKGKIPNRILIEGPAGYGKTTLSSKLCFDHANGEEYMKRFKMVILIRLREFEKTLDYTIINTVDKKDFPAEDILEVINKNQKHTLFVLDGLDEVDEKSLEQITPILTAGQFPDSTVVVTSRHGNIKLRKKEGPLPSLLQYVDKRIIIGGLTGENKLKFLRTYFIHHNPDTLASLVEHVQSNFIKVFDRGSTNLFDCPLFLLLLVIVAEDSDINSLKTKTQLFKALFNFLIRRMLAKTGAIEQKRDLFSFDKQNDSPYIQMLSQFGCLAMKSWKKGKYSFTEDEILDHCGNDSTIFKLGFLTKNDSKVGLKRESWYEPITFSFLEFSIAYYFCVTVILNSKLDRFIAMNDFVKYKNSNPQQFDLVLPFLFGICGRHFSTFVSNLANCADTKVWLRTFNDYGHLQELVDESELECFELVGICSQLIPTSLCLTSLYDSKSFSILCKSENGLLHECLYKIQDRGSSQRVYFKEECCIQDDGSVPLEASLANDQIEWLQNISTHRVIIIRLGSGSEIMLRLCDVALTQQLEKLSTWLQIENPVNELPIYEIICKFSNNEKILTNMMELFHKELIESVFISFNSTRPSSETFTSFLDSINQSKLLLDIEIDASSLGMHEPLVLDLSMFEGKKWRRIELRGSTFVHGSEVILSHDDENWDLQRLVKAVLLLSVERLCVNFSIVQSYVFLESDTPNMHCNLRELFFESENHYLECLLQACSLVHFKNLQVLGIRFTKEIKERKNEQGVTLFFSSLLLLLSHCHSKVILQFKEYSEELVGRFLHNLQEDLPEVKNREQKTERHLDTLLLDDALLDEATLSDMTIEKLKAALRSVHLRQLWILIIQGNSVVEERYAEFFTASEGFGWKVVRLEEMPLCFSSRRHRKSSIWDARCYLQITVPT